MNYTPLAPLPEPLQNVFDDASTELYEARRTAIETRDIDLLDHIDSLCDEEQEVVDSLIDPDFDLVGIGSARVVIGIPGGNAVVKLPRYGGDDHPLDDGYVQNGTEVELWSQAEEGMMRNALLPILDARLATSPDDGPSWVVMPKVVPLVDSDMDEDKKMSHIRTLNSVIRESGLDELLEVAEVSKKNVAVVEDLPRLFDYGRGVDVPSYGLDS